MIRMWLNQYISSESLELMVSTWSLTPNSTDFAVAIRLCKQFGVVETDTLHDVQKKIEKGLKDLVENLNKTYSVSSDAMCESLYTLSLWIPYEEVYAVVSGVDGSHKATIRVEVDITNLMYVDLDLVLR